MKERRLHARKPKGVVQPIAPLYNPSIHRAGDTVIMLRGGRRVQVTIPSIDADGQPIYED